MTTSDTRPRIEPPIWDEWHVVCALEDLKPGHSQVFELLERRITLRRHDDGSLQAWLGRVTMAQPLRARVHFGYVWTTLGTPAHEMFDVPECLEIDRRLIHCGSFGVHVSAPRAIENFLDLAHFPFVHTGYLGTEPHTEVSDYDVALSDDEREIIARRCRFFQPLASLAAKQAFEVEYVYRVPHPYCAVLYKSCPLDTTRNDVIAMFVRPMSQERICANLFMAVLDRDHSDTQLRQFQQIIFGQDKPVLENQQPRRLPLDPADELAIRADRSSVSYRRWLRTRGVRYGTVTATPARTPLALT